MREPLERKGRRRGIRDVGTIREINAGERSNGSDEGERGRGDGIPELDHLEVLAMSGDMGSGGIIELRIGFEIKTFNKAKQRGIEHSF